MDSLHSTSNESDLEAQGWVSPQRVDQLLKMVDQIASGDYLAVPKGDCKLSRALHDLAGVVGRKESQHLKDVVALTSNIADSLVAASEMRMTIRETSERSQTIASTSEELAASIDTVAENSSAVATETEAVQKLVDSGDQSSRRTNETVQEIAELADTASQKVKQLNKASDEIGSIIELIEEIAFQTNMLALNASVEAARAGQAGAGFSVVAQEVRRLADQTKNATVDIAQRIRVLRDETEGISKSVEDMGSAVERGREATVETSETMQQVAERMRGVTEHVQNVSSVINEQKGAVTQVAESISAVTDRTERNVNDVENTLDVLGDSRGILSREMDEMTDLNLPKVFIHRSKFDHVMWKMRIASMLAGREEVDSAELTDHHQCRLGKWYDAVDDQAIRQLPAFGELDEPHAAVHAHGKKAAALYQRGDVDAAAGELEHLADNSQTVVELLDRLASEMDRLK
ncbi:methyl-accepting chemotaxis protein [Halorhodospira halochloris]|uniref:methyl-accepting chemotaxis protein n=1 Tax=Halorhodospira halochloris TaxID=1052 RepID=UPI001EE8EBF8|nr:methyl-accepting chemotaxis protein [Halorhodospira halochloris]MCG5529477.1 methyl-accepting chemotaxis protein [Halorhodospira halochloris]MCG5547454.1 methyl-accepting chemotaxis protein [Halorhodospira halochloris]